MVSMPGAVSKAIFDLIWDFFRDKSKTLERSRSRGLEAGTQDQGAREDNDQMKEDSNKFGLESAAPAPIVESAERDLEEGTEAAISSELLDIPPYKISLVDYLGEKLKHTKVR